MGPGYLSSRGRAAGGVARNLMVVTGLMGPVILSGCDGPTEVLCVDGSVIVPVSIPGARLALNVNFTDPKSLVRPGETSATGMLRLDAFLQSGVFLDGPRDVCGNPTKARPVLNDTLTVGGIVLVPTTAGFYQYVHEQDMTSAEFVGLLAGIDPPDVAGLQPDPVAYEWYGLGRAGSDTVVLQAGDDLQLLVVTAAGTPDPAPYYQQWILSVTGDTSAVQVTGQGFPPDTLVLGRRFLPPSDEGDWRAELILIQQWSDNRYDDPDAYAIDLFLQVQLGWQVTLAP